MISADTFKYNRSYSQVIGSEEGLVQYKTYKWGSSDQKQGLEGKVCLSRLLISWNPEQHIPIEIKMKDRVLILTQNNPLKFHAATIEKIWFDYNGKGKMKYIQVQVRWDDDGRTDSVCADSIENKL